MKPTLLLVFIHGFQGGDDTFARFPPHLRALLSHALPHLDVIQIQYPKFETRGQLDDCVATFKEWLQNKVIDLEVELGTPSPTIDPGVRVILIGHSMGGIVGADTLLSIASEKPITSSSGLTVSQPSPTFMFPSIIGLLAFDTPYLGLSPGIVAHNAETHIQTARSAWNAYNVVSQFSTSAASSSSAAVPAVAAGSASGIVAEGAAADAAVDAAAIPAWQRWSRVAMFAGAAGAVLAGGAAAYANRSALSEGWGWATSHLEFVGCLAREAVLKERVAAIVELHKSRAVGWANVYNRLGNGAGTLSWTGKDENPKEDGWAHAIAGQDRTFCVLPAEEKEARQFFVESINDKAGNEITAHCHMFTPKENPGYYSMSEKAKEIITRWVRDSWHVSIDESKEAVDEDPELIHKDEIDEANLGYDEMDHE